MPSEVDLTQRGFETVRVIGHGRSGSVYQVRNMHEISRMFVCKLIHLDAVAQADRRLAEQEASLLRSLDHRSIVKFEDSFRLESGLWLGLIMEYCDGGDLRHAIKLQSSQSCYFPENQIMTWFAQVLEGLRYIHSRHIIHRDIKTSNIFLRGPPPYRCLIGDFGISRVLEETLSSAQTVIGTPYYLSPEVCKREAYTTRSDMWSLGACLYEMAMLEMAFKCDNLLSLVSRIIHEAYEPMNLEHFSPDLVSIVGRLLRKNPDDRPSARQLLKEKYVCQFSDDPGDADTPIVLAPVDLKRRPTLRSRAGPRPRIANPIVEENLDPSLPLEVAETIPQALGSHEQPVIYHMHLLPSEDPMVTANSESIPPPLTRF